MALEEPIAITLTKAQALEICHCLLLCSQSIPKFFVMVNLEECRASLLSQTVYFLSQAETSEYVAAKAAHRERTEQEDEFPEIIMENIESK